MSSTVSFLALRRPVFRAYFCGAASLMMADSIEHVISYWMMWQKFHSPALAGFAVISHWVPFLFFAPRRLRFLGAGIVAAHQLIIAATGNYGFFNLLTLALCVPLLTAQQEAGP